MISLRQGHVLDLLRAMPDESVHCVVTSPPYWGLRSYKTEPQVWGGDPAHAHEWNGAGARAAKPDRATQGKDANGSGAFGERGGQGAKESRGAALDYGARCACGAWRGELGLEPTPEMYVEHLVEVFREVRRVLREDGTLWLNIGDSYASKPNGSIGATTLEGSLAPHAESRRVNGRRHVGGPPSGLKHKDLVGIPWRLAFALQADGWWLRSEIIWSKPNPMPESVRDRPTKAHEQVFLLSKAASYFYDAEAVKEPDQGRPDGNREGFKGRQGGAEFMPMSGGVGSAGWVPGNGRNARSVWTIATQPSPAAHFATFPQELAERCILAGTSERGCCAECGAPWERTLEHPDFSQQPKRRTESDDKHRAKGDRTSAGQAWQDWRNANPSRTTGWRPICEHAPARVVPAVVLDPFSGTATTGVAARKLGRSYVGLELQPEYHAIAERRLTHVRGPLFEPEPEPAPADA